MVLLYYGRIMKIGIVGLPNVGKSTLFNALTSSKQAEAQNYPFCTIEPNQGIVEVPDNRLSQLSATSKSKKTIPTTVEFVDIAGLVSGASKGEGLGNKFLAHIREVDAIVQVVRVFEDSNITHVHGKIDPQEDIDVISTELALADLATTTKRLEALRKEAKASTDKKLMRKIDVLIAIHDGLEQNQAVRDNDNFAEFLELLPELKLLTAKPQLIVYNKKEGGADQGKEGSITLCAQLEAELAELSPEDAKEYMETLGMTQSGLDRLIQAGYQLLGLLTFFTSGEQETRAWTVLIGASAPQAAGRIHTDFEKAFIRAEVVDWEKFVDTGGWTGAKEAGVMRLEGKDYVVKDGDVCYFHTGV